MKEKRPYNNDDMYDGVQNLFEENFTLREPALENLSEITTQDIPQSDNNSTYEGIAELFSEDDNISQDDTFNNSIYQDNNSNDSIHQDNNDGLSDMSWPEESDALNINPGYFTLEQFYERKRLDYEQWIRARISQEDLDEDGLSYLDLSEVMLASYDETIYQYDHV